MRLILNRSFLGLISTLALLLMLAAGSQSFAGEGEEGAPAAPVDQNLSQYNKLFDEVGHLRGQILESKEQIKTLIEEKNRTDDVQKQASLVEQIITAHNKLKQDVADYNKKRDQLRYRFPGHGHITDKAYRPIRQQSVKEIESEMNLDKRLKKFQIAVQQKYSTFTKENGQGATHPKVTPPTQKERQRLRLVK